MRKLTLLGLASVLALAVATPASAGQFKGGCFSYEGKYTFHLGPSGSATYYGDKITWSNPKGWSKTDDTHLKISRRLDDPYFPGATFYFTITTEGIVKDSAGALYTKCG